MHTLHTLHTASTAISLEPIMRRDTARALVGALAFGVATQALFWDASIGLNFPLWTALAVGAGGVWLRDERAGALPWALGAGAITASSALAIRASVWSLVLGVPATVGWLALFGASLAGARATELPRALLGLALSAPAGIADAAGAPARAASAKARPIAARVGLGVLIGAPTAALFAALLSSDTSFRALLSRLGDRAGTAIGFTIAALATAFGALVARRMVRPAGPSRSPTADEEVAAGPYRSVDGASVATPLRAVITPLTWGLVLGQVALVFALFAGANVRHLFGGVATIRSEGSLTYAAYLHSGFGELVVAALLSVGLVVAGHALVTPVGAPVAAGGRALAAVEGALLALGAVVLASCAQRLLIYEDAYGATYLRLGVLVVEIGLGATLALTLVKSLRRSWRGHWVALGAAALGVATGAALFDADGYVARTNLDRALAGKPLDETYLESLGPDACGALGHPALAAREGLGARLSEVWTPEKVEARSRRGVVSCAR